MTTAITLRRPATLHRPGLLGRGVFDDVFDSFFNDFPTHLRQSTQGYPVADIFQDGSGNTVLEFALAGFSRDMLKIDVLPEDGSITVTGETSTDDGDTNRRIARRSFRKTYVNYDNNLDLTSVTADYENGLLRLVVPTRPEANSLTVQIN